MKAFIASLILLFSLVACSLAGCLFVEKTVDRLYMLEARLPTKEEEGELPICPELLEAVSLWESSADRISATVGLKYVNAVTLSLQNVCDFYCYGSPSDYISSRHALLTALKALSDAESFSLSGVI